MAYLFQTRSKSGKLHPRWRFQFTDWNGRRRTATGTNSKAETAKLAARIELDHELVRKGLRARPAGWAKNKNRPFAEAVKEYLEWGAFQGGRGGRPWSSKHQNSRSTILNQWQKHLQLDTLADLDGILPSVERVLRELQRDGRSGKTLQNYAATLRAFIAWCVKREWLEKDPLRNLSAFDTTPVTRRRALSEEDVRRLLHAAPEHRRLLYATALCTGLRAGELRALDVADLDLNTSSLRLRAEWTKNRRAGVQPVPVALGEKLGEFAGTEEAAVRYRRLHRRAQLPKELPRNPLLYVPSHAARDLDRDLAKAGIPKRTHEGKVDFHALRTAFVTLVVESGANIKEAQQMARHASPELTLNVYARSRESRRIELTEAVGRAVLGDEEIAPPDPPEETGPAAPLFSAPRPA